MNYRRISLSCQDTISAGLKDNYEDFFEAMERLWNARKFFAAYKEIKSSGSAIINIDGLLKVLSFVWKITVLSQCLWCGLCRGPSGCVCLSSRCFWIAVETLWNLLKVIFRYWIYRSELVAVLIAVAFLRVSILWTKRLLRISMIYVIR